MMQRREDQDRGDRGSAGRAVGGMLSAGALSYALTRVIRGVLPDGESARATEAADTEAITAGILALQQQYAAEQHRGLARGTHAKGICVGGSFEVFDLASRYDPVLAGRLARGLFARPGSYPAQVRFANAESHIYPDRKKDVRACSFSLEVPAGVLGAEPCRQDFSLNNARTFPINDTHAFAVTVRVAMARTVAAGWMALPLADKLTFARVAVLGARQERPGTVPYQQETYWSTVPFQHGPGEAAKYVAAASPENPAAPLGDGPDCLSDELARHLAQDAVPARFDFGIQLLEPARMTYWGRPRAADFWIENASVVWREDQAPFYTVGRLTLQAGSVQPPDVCAARFIDVTANSTAECRPIGGINRARAGAERASREARLGAAVPASAG